MKSLFVEALDLDPAQRPRFLASACAHEPDVGEEVAVMLADYDKTSPILGREQQEALAIDASKILRPERIGPYRIVQELGQGGMGVVYLAEQEKPIHRRVALKIIKLGMDTQQVIARFETEREALALMSHPNVAKVFDAGTTENGRPYFVMEYVPGVPITEYCDKHRLNTEERLRLFMDVCNAVQHAHQKGIIHRDIKPSNVLVSVATEPPSHEVTMGKGSAGVSQRTAGAEIKVIDFGVAKATQHRLTERTLHTEHGQLIGTPGYMSPEQAETTALDIDTRTDVYSLGVLLYELLVGELPFDPHALRNAGLAEIQRIIREVDPPKPSTRLSSLQSEPEAEATRSGAAPGTQSNIEHQPLASARGSDFRAPLDAVARNRRTEPRTLIRQIRGDLDWIVMKCLEKDRTRRYDTATGLALEIQRYLNHEPVLAGPPSVMYRVRKFVRRNRIPAAAAAAVSFSLLVGLAGTAAMYFRADQARQNEAEQRRLAEKNEQRAEDSREESEAVKKFLSDMLAAVQPEKEGKDVTVRAILDKAATSLVEKFHDKSLIEAELRVTIGWSYRQLGLPDVAREHLERAVSIYGRLLGEKDFRTLAVLNALATIFLDQGKYDVAEAKQRALVETRRRVLGEEHPETMASLNNLAIALNSRGRYAEAEELTRKASDVQRRVLGDEHPITVLTLSSLANNLISQGRYVEAEQLIRKIFEVQGRILGAEHPNTIDSLNNLAATLYMRGRYAEAEEQYRKILEIRRRVLGEDHPDTLASINNLGNVRFCRGHFEEAEHLFRQVLAIWRRVLGDEHPHTLRSMGILANALHAQSHY